MFFATSFGFFNAIIICETVITLNEEEIQVLSWQDFVKSIDSESKPQLIEYLKIRQLYLNEPILVEDDM